MFYDAQYAQHQVWPVHDVVIDDCGEILPDDWASIPEARRFHTVCNLNSNPDPYPTVSFSLLDGTRRRRRQMGTDGLRCHRTRACVALGSLRLPQKKYAESATDSLRRASSGRLEAPNAITLIGTLSPSPKPSPNFITITGTLRPIWAHPDP